MPSGWDIDARTLWSLSDDLLLQYMTLVAARSIAADRVLGVPDGTGGRMGWTRRYDVLYDLLSEEARKRGLRTA
jgi:hypothetical protein